MDFHQSSLVTQNLTYSDDKQQVITVLIGVLTKLSRKGPEVDRKLGKLSCEIRKPHTPWFTTFAEVQVSQLGGKTSVLIAIRCERDLMQNRQYCVRSLKAMLGWLLAPGNGLNLLDLP